MKEILLAGGIIAFPYKRKKLEWLGEAKIYIYNGHYCPPRVLLEVDHLEEFAIEDIDKAIEYFKEKVFNKENWWYKMDDVIRELHMKGDYVDLEEEEDLERCRKLQLKKQKDEINNGNRLS